MKLKEQLNLREAMKSRGYTEEEIEEVFQHEDLRAIGYGEETLESLYENYFKDATVIEGEFTTEKLLQAIDPDFAWEDFWENANA
jgi:broad-specificity NMP kinase